MFFLNVFKAPIEAMASAPPLETSTLVGYPPPPSYEEALGSNPQYPPMPYAPAPAPALDMKTSVPPYPTQAYCPMYPPPPAQQGQPVTSPVGNGPNSTVAFSDYTF